jgi:hypothetical protein
MARPQCDTPFVCLTIEVNMFTLGNLQSFKTFFSLANQRGSLHTKKSELARHPNQLIWITLGVVCGEIVSEYLFHS